jgi:Bifunctional DNA primase/polymerase, N-terminal/Primase C terminal 2 (PriCT-2)
MSDFLDFAERSGLALFPMPHGSKVPHGIVASFAHDWSRSPEQWSAWRTSHPKCNFGIVAGPSRFVIADIDVAEVGFEVAWGYWTGWCQSHGLPVYQSYCQSARGGRHIAFQVPADFDISTLRQVPLIGPIEGVSKKAIVDLRVGNGFVVAPGSYYDGSAKGEQSGLYTLLPNAQVHAAPHALLAACARAPRQSVAVRVGTAAAGDVEKVLTWMADHDCFAAYHSWLEVGMILRAEFGDDPGFALWQITNDGSCSAEAEAVKWRSFSAEAGTDSVKIGTLRKRAKDAGCPHSIGTSTESMFAGVAATLPPGSGMSPRSVLPPLPYGTNPTPTNSLMGNTAAVVADLGRPTVESFIAANQASRSATQSPQIPDAASSHPLVEPLNAAIALIVGNAQRAPKCLSEEFLNHMNHL